MKKLILVIIQFLIKLLDGDSVRKIKDGYHTFEELYDFRMMYNSLLFNEWAMRGLYDVHKSLRHNDGEKCFNNGWFVVVAMLPTGQITNHYKLEDWDRFNLPEYHIAKYEFDGHTPKDVLDRMGRLNALNFTVKGEEHLYLDKLHNIYRHGKGGLYKVVNYCTFKIDGFWRDAFIYTDAHNSQYFGRLAGDFDQKFKRTNKSLGNWYQGIKEEYEL